MLFVTAFLPGGDFLGQRLLVGDTSLETSPRQDAELRSSHVQPTAVLWRVVPFEPLNQPAGLGSGKGLVERRRLMGVEIVLHQHDFLRLRKVHVGYSFEDLSIIHGRVAIGDLDMSPAFQRGEDHEQIGRSIPFILIIVARRLPWLGRDRHTRFGDQLLRGLVHADHGILRIVRSLINLQHVLHAGYERRVGIRWDHPLLLQMRPEEVFLASVRSCCRWRGQQSSVRQPALRAVATSTACDPWAVRSRPARSVWPRRLRRRCAFWPRLGSACGPERPRTLLPPTAGGSARPYRRWYRGRLRFGCRSIRRQLRSCPPSTEYGLW